MEKKEGEVGAKAQDEEKEKKTEGEKSEDTATKTKEYVHLQCTVEPLYKEVRTLL